MGKKIKFYIRDPKSKIGKDTEISDLTELDGEVLSASDAIDKLVDERRREFWSKKDRLKLDLDYCQETLSELKKHVVADMIKIRKWEDEKRRVEQKIYELENPPVINFPGARPSEEIDREPPGRAR